MYDIRPILHDCLVYRPSDNMAILKSDLFGPRQTVVAQFAKQFHNDCVSERNNLEKCNHLRARSVPTMELLRVAHF